MDTGKHLIRGLSLAAVLMAGSCAAPGDDSHRFADPMVSHPITVEPDYQSLRLFYSPADKGIAPADQGRFDDFVAAYRAHGNGAIAVDAPAGIGAQAAIGFFAQRINEMGVPRDHILVATHDAPDGDMRVQINYVAYQARTGSCGDWSDNLANTLDNETARNLGCATQKNLVAQIADPRDLISPRPMEDADANRRAAVLGHYEKGEITQATKHTADSAVEQSADASGIGQ